ncbi:MAG TPA: hypothetical protein VLS93_06900 [Anaeromyxobacteraceae bacterium]|nr:hypothetical protein [Anaeromyxobacteraceae bacterium]
MARDPRYRPYRIALWIFYFALIAVSSGVTIASIVRHLRGPNRTPAAATLPTRAALRVCVRELEALNREQNVRSWRLGMEIGAPDAVARWDAWSKDWERRVDDLSERCLLDRSDPAPEGFPGHGQVARARDAILAVHRAYRAQVNRFAQEEADLARAAAEALDAARASADR